MRALFGGTQAGGHVVSLSHGGVLALSEGASSDDLLAMLDAALKTIRAKKTSIDEIVVDRGPGGFSSVRRRVAVATGLARALGAKICAAGEISPEEAALLPANAFAANTPVLPLYASDPKITISKKKKTWNAH